MSRLFLPFVIAVGMTYCFSRFVIPICLKNLPIPVQIFPAVNRFLIVAIFVSSFGSLYYLLAWHNKDVAPPAEPSQVAQEYPSGPPSKLSHPPDATREAACVLALEALRQGTALSVTISMLPKLERVYHAAQNLLEISPRYQEQVTTAEKGLSDASDNRDKSLDSYLNKVVELGRYKPEYIFSALDSIRNGGLTPREKIVTNLLTNHVNSMRDGTRADPVHWLSEFTQRFRDFVD